MTSKWTNLSFYRFFALGDAAALKDLRVKLKALTADLQMKGTILLASEGVNVMVSGLEPSIEKFKSYCIENLGIDPRTFKEAEEPKSSFTRMLVKIKKEIIPVGSPSIRPDIKTAPRLSAQKLREWMDQGKPLLLLDTRNEYEIETGAFVNTQSFGLDHSRDFTKKAAENIEYLKEQARSQPIVTVCTGGIRCEKASAVLLDLGLENVYQLDGGILTYFKENGSKHFNGNCFVFDWRLAVNGELKPVKRGPETSPDSSPHSSSAEPLNEDFGRHRHPQNG